MGADLRAGLSGRLLCACSLVCALVGCGSRPAVPAVLVDSPVFGRLLVDVPVHPGPDTPIVLLLGADRDEVPADAIVVPLETTGWQRRVEADGRRCWYPAGELAAVTAQVAAAAGVPSRPPFLVGRGWGGRVAVAAALQAPPGTLAGVAANAFCPTLPVARALCGSESWTPGPPPEIALPRGVTPPIYLSAACPEGASWATVTAADLPAATSALLTTAAR